MRPQLQFIADEYRGAQRRLQDLAILPRHQHRHLWQAEHVWAEGSKPRSSPEQRD